MKKGNIKIYSGNDLKTSLQRDEDFCFDFLDDFLGGLYVDFILVDDMAKYFYLMEQEFKNIQVEDLKDEMIDEICSFFKDRYIVIYFFNLSKKHCSSKFFVIKDLSYLEDEIKRFDKWYKEKELK